MLSTVTQSGCPNADRYGITASLVCAIHCAISPVIIIFAPALSLWWSSTVVHIIAAFVVVPLALYALYRGKVAHKKNWPMIFGFIGSSAIVLALFPFWAQSHPIIYTWGVHSTTVSELPVRHFCCPSVVRNVDGGLLSIPWPSIITLIGSVFLIVGHVGNIIGFQCRHHEVESENNL